ncbi:DeoR/GlpR family DNA-binding transcription regulator [Cohnella herbarum]|uniref:DeoR/GlpR transcriptional regulator n=1 Tax=Cohnella herbarum TaxID=2728023 RepID=A0A7Z2VRI6_9BACL|nr:DeoR/GlpR family DNA-binding transcription regulator [Cohnella herbarum]QJD87864.1 DeoR/GlpR transcriptional regulator [Cohnella herbarum]
MLPIQRKSAIIEYLSKEGGCTIKHLSRALDVSEMTVRRDLKQLESSGQVILSHGGAVLAQSYVHEPATIEKESRNQDVKERLASYAIKHFVSEGDVLILEGGTTVARMPPYLQSFSQLTILSNGLNTLNALNTGAGRNVVLCCGGMLREQSSTFVGPVAESFFEQFHANTVFLSGLGFTPETGFTDPNLLDTRVKQAMIRSAGRTVMLLDSSKFGARSFTTTAMAADVSAVITDSGVPEEIKDYFIKLGVPLHIV